MVHGPKFRTLIAWLAALGGSLVLAPTAPAALITFGSDLRRPATVSEAHGADTAFWAVALPGARSTTFPRSGQVVEVRLKGTAVPSRESRQGAAPPLTEVHFQALRPQAGGSVLVVNSSDAFNVPHTGSRNRVSAYAPTNQCVSAGDRFAFNNEGGFDPASGYPEGVPFRVFARSPSATTSQYTGDNGAKNGAVFSGRGVVGQELLMQVTLATGADATPLCPGGTLGTTGRRSPPQPGGPAVRIPSQRPVVQRDGRVAIFVSCGHRPCSGSLRLTSGRRTLGRTNYRLPAFRSSAIRIRVRRAPRRARASTGGATRVLTLRRAPY